MTAIASRDGARAAATAAQLGIPRHHGSYQDLVDDPEVEAVYIPLPNHLHGVWTLQAAAAGKHVLCEKPFAMTSAEAQQMVDACTAAGVALMEAFMYRFHPLWRPRRRARPRRCDRRARRHPGLLLLPQRRSGGHPQRRTSTAAAP